MASRGAGRVTALFVCAAASSGALLLILGAQLTFFLDDWEILLSRPGVSAESVLNPHNEHIVIAPVLIYKALLATAGLDAQLAFRAVATAVFLISIALVFVWLRRRIDERLALAGSVVLLFLGAAWEDLLWPFQLGLFGSMAAGMGALVVLDRESRGADRGACVLLTAGALFSSLGLAFLAAGAVAIWPALRQRLYVVAVPLVLFSLWWVGWGQHTDASNVSLANIATAPQYAFDGVAASIASVLGLSAPIGADPAGAYGWGRPLALAAIAGLAFVLVRRGRVSRSFWVVLALGVSFWLLAGFNEVDQRAPTVSRYQYMGAIFVLLVAAEPLRGIRLSRTAVGVATVVTCAALASNLSQLFDAHRMFESTTELERAGLAAFEIAREEIDPELLLTEDLIGTGSSTVQAREYLTAVDQFGSPAYTDAELELASEPARAAADRVLAVALGASLTPAGGRDSEHCPIASRRSGERITLAVPPSGIRFEGGPSVKASVRLRRYAGEGFPADLGRVSLARPALLEIPDDAAAERWQARITATGPLSVCRP